MAYCTLADLKAAVPEEILLQLTDDEGRNAIDQTRIGRAISDGDTLIDSFLRRRYALPVVPVPDLLRKVSVDLALYHLYARRFASGEVPAGARARYTDSVELLKRIDAGQLLLQAEPADVTDVSALGPEPLVNRRRRLWPPRLLDRL